MDTLNQEIRLEARPMRPHTLLPSGVWKELLPLTNWIHREEVDLDFVIKSLREGGKLSSDASKSEKKANENVDKEVDEIDNVKRRKRKDYKNGFSTKEKDVEATKEKNKEKEKYEDKVSKKSKKKRKEEMALEKLKSNYALLLNKST